MPVTFADVAKSEYILLTTFTKDGRPKPTPIWAAPDGNGLLVITPEKSWKVKRIRNTPRVTIAKCDGRTGRRGDYCNDDTLLPIAFASCMSGR